MELNRGPSSWVAALNADAYLRSAHDLLHFCNMDTHYNKAPLYVLPHQHEGALAALAGWKVRKWHIVAEERFVERITAVLGDLPGKANVHEKRPRRSVLLKVASDGRLPAGSCRLS